MLLARRTLLATTAAALARPTLAQPAWPAGRPIEIIVPFAPGGGMDAMARAIAPFLAARLPGARVVVSNKPGAGGQVGTEAVANAAPDGFTLGACATPTVLSQPIERPVRWSRTPAAFSSARTACCATCPACWRRHASSRATSPTAPRALAGTTTSPRCCWRRRWAFG